MRQVGQLPRDTPGVVVSDVRFFREWVALEELGALFIRIIHPGLRPEGLGGLSSHRSETELRHLPYDALIPNGRDENFARDVRIAVSALHHSGVQFFERQ